MQKFHSEDNLGSAVSHRKIENGDTTICSHRSMAIGISVEIELPIEGLYLRNLVSWEILQDKIVVKYSSKHTKAAKCSEVLSSVWYFPKMVSLVFTKLIQRLSSQWWLNVRDSYLLTPLVIHDNSLRVFNILFLIAGTCMSVPQKWHQVINRYIQKRENETTLISLFYVHHYWFFLKNISKVHIHAIFQIQQHWMVSSYN